MKLKKGVEEEIDSRLLAIRTLCHNQNSNFHQLSATLLETKSEKHAIIGELNEIYKLVHMLNEELARITTMKKRIERLCETTKFEEFESYMIQLARDSVRRLEEGNFSHEIAKKENELLQLSTQLEALQPVDSSSSRSNQTISTTSLATLKEKMFEMEEKLNLLSSGTNKLQTEAAELSQKLVFYRTSASLPGNTDSILHQNSVLTQECQELEMMIQSLSKPPAGTLKHAQRR